MTSHFALFFTAGDVDRYSAWTYPQRMMEEEHAADLDHIVGSASG